MSQQLSQLLWCAHHRLIVSSLSQDFTQTYDLVSYHALPKPAKRLPQTPKSPFPLLDSIQRRTPQFCPHNHFKEAQVRPCGANWLLEGARPSLSKFASEPLVLILLSSLCLLGCAPCVLLWTPNITFPNRHVLWLCRAPLRTNAPK
jgi:hypothetical protein